MTKDSRGRNKGCGKRMCGALSVGLLAAAVVVAVLVGGMTIYHTYFFKKNIYLYVCVLKLG